MDQLIEVPFSQPKKGRAIDLGIAANVVMQGGTEMYPLWHWSKSL